MSRKLLDGTHNSNNRQGGRKALLELTPEILQDLIRPLRIGASIMTSASYNKISYETMRLWVIKGHEDPDSLYGAFLKEIQKAIAEWEIRDISIIDAHAMGRPAQYEMEVVRDRDGSIARADDGKPLMQVARNSDGNPILKAAEIKSDWKAAMERLARRKPRFWRRLEPEEGIEVMTFDNKVAESKEALSFEERVAKAIEKLEEDV